LSHLQVTARAELILDLEISRMMFDEIYRLPKPPDGWAKLSTASFCLPEKNVSNWKLYFNLLVWHWCVPTCYDDFMRPENILLIFGGKERLPELPQAAWQLLAAQFRVPDRNVGRSNVEFDLRVHDVLTGGIDTTPKIREHLAQKLILLQCGPAIILLQPPLCWQARLHLRRGNYVNTRVLQCVTTKLTTQSIYC